MNLLRTLSEEVAATVEAVGPAVLHVRAIQGGSTRLASGSAVLIEGGLALTSARIVGEAILIEADLQDGRSALADVVGVDPATDLALLRLSLEEGVVGAAPGDSNDLRLGDLVVAIGSPFGLARTVALGSISALGRTLRTECGRPIQGVIQTDAPLHAGTSGGALVDARRRLVGIIAAPVAAGAGLCFAVPSNAASFVMSELLAHGRVRRAYLGVGVEEVFLPSRLVREHGLEGTRGVAVLEVEAGTPASLAGVAPGDVIVALRGTRTGSVADLHRLLDAEAIGLRLPIDVLRRDALRRLEVRPLDAAGLKRR